MNVNDEAEYDGYEHVVCQRVGQESIRGVNKRHSAFIYIFNKIIKEAKWYLISCNEVRLG